MSRRHDGGTGKCGLGEGGSNGVKASGVLQGHPGNVLAGKVVKMSEWMGSDGV
jgi:hypothetical protein